MIIENLKNKLLLIVKILFINFIIFANASAIEDDQIKSITEGDKNAKIEILVYESLTCPHCAMFHKDVYPDLKKKFYR